MEAGHEVDELVATMVMGEPRPTEVPTDALERMLVFSPCRSEGKNWICLADYENADVSVWEAIHFSVDIKAAWTVVEKFTEERDVLLEYYNLPIGNQWRFMIGMGLFAAFADTAPHAICLAALEAAGFDHTEVVNE